MHSHITGNFSYEMHRKRTSIKIATSVIVDGSQTLSKYVPKPQSEFSEEEKKSA